VDAKIVLSHRGVEKQTPGKRTSARGQCSHQNLASRFLRRFDVNPMLVEEVNRKRRK
jgi:hypothetical protein